MLDFGGIDFEAMMMDTDGDGVLDTPISGVDIDGDGVVDMFMFDSDANGVDDTFFTAFDTNGDGIEDTIVEGYDMNEDSVLDVFHTIGLEGQGEGITEYIDTDGDNIFDTYINYADTDGDGIFDAAEVYDITNNFGIPEFDGMVDLDETSGSGLYLDDLENFDPSDADADDLSGNPAESMQEWEFQGETNRCALYSQKFVIEELTGQDIDIEEIADLAEENGWFSEENGTPLMDMNKVLDHFGVENEMHWGRDINDIQNCLDNGGKVIVSIDADEIWFGEQDDLFTPDSGANHAVEVIGIDYSNEDEPMVILNDSGNPNGCGEMIPMDCFIDAWEDGNYQMIECY